MSKTTKRPIYLGREKAAEMLKNVKGFASAVFIKKDGTKRNMTFRLGVKKHLNDNTVNKSSRRSRTSLGYLGVYDMLEKEYRTINLQTVSEFKTSGNVYRVRG